MQFYKRKCMRAQGFFLAAGMHCGIRKNKSKLDLASSTRKGALRPSACTPKTGQGRVLTVSKENLKDGMAQAFIVNAGNAQHLQCRRQWKLQKKCASSPDFL